MYAGRYFAARYFARRYFPRRTATSALFEPKYFPHRFFAARFFTDRYFPGPDLEVTPEPEPEPIIPAEFLHTRRRPHAITIRADLVLPPFGIQARVHVSPADIALRFDALLELGIAANIATKAQPADIRMQAQVALLAMSADIGARVTPRATRTPQDDEDELLAWYLDNAK